MCGEGSIATSDGKDRIDFHHGSRHVLLADGSWQRPELLCVIDDRSRLVCHLQWYLDETAEALVHGLTQAFQKRGLPREILMDNGSAMKAATVSGPFSCRTSSSWETLSWDLKPQ